MQNVTNKIIFLIIISLTSLPVYATKGAFYFRENKIPIRSNPRKARLQSPRQQQMLDKKASKQREKCFRTAAGICCGVGVLLMLDNCLHELHN